MLKSTLLHSFTASILIASNSSYAVEDLIAPESGEAPVFYDARPELTLATELKAEQATTENSPVNATITEVTPPNLVFDRNLNSFSVPNQAFDKTTLPSGGMVIEGDKMHIYLDRQMRAIGHAAIHDEKRDIYGDNIDYDVQNDELHVTGNARIESEDTTVSGPEMRMVLGENTGEMNTPEFILNNTFKSFATKKSASSNNRSQDEPLMHQNIEDSLGDYRSPTKQQLSSRGNASSVSFEGENLKRLKNARYTSCEAGSNDWYLKAGELELNNNSQSAVAKNAYIEFKGIPILYSPWLDFSFSTQRKSGLLAPTFGTTSQSGFELLTPYYWNISPNMDATLGTRVLTKRGVQLQGEFRYLTENFSGVDNLEFLPNDSLSDSTRYYAKLKHSHILGSGWSVGYDLEKVSDNQYFSELSTNITTTSRINLPQQMYVNYSDDVWSFNGLIQKYQTLDNVSYPYERLPQLTLNGDKDWSMFNAKLNAQWVSFDRTADAPKIVTGSRFTAYPSISMPLAEPYGYITPKIGLHYTSYQLDNVSVGSPSSPDRALPIFSLDGGLYFDRETKIVNNSYTQTLEPRMFYVYIPEKDQSLFPVFDTGESDLNIGTLFQENQFTGNDRINNANQLSLALSTRLVDSQTGVQRLAATIGQRYYFTDQKVGLPGATLRTSNSTDVVAAVTANLTNHWDADFIWQYDTDNSDTIRNSLGARYNPEPGRVLNIGYRYTKEKLEQLNISGQWPLGNGWYSMGRFNYSVKEKGIIESLAGIEYDAGCWQARSVIQRVSTATADANYAFFFQLELGGLASIGANPLLLLKRNIPGYTVTGEIPDQYKQPLYE